MQEPCLVETSLIFEYIHSRVDLPQLKDPTLSRSSSAGNSQKYTQSLFAQKIDQVSM